MDIKTVVIIALAALLAVAVASLLRAVWVIRRKNRVIVNYIGIDKAVIRLKIELEKTLKEKKELEEKLVGSL